MLDLIKICKSINWISDYSLGLYYKATTSGNKMDRNLSVKNCSEPNYDFFLYQTYVHLMHLITPFYICV